MKKILMGTTALIAMGLASGQAAAEVELGLGGFMNQYVAYSDNDNPNTAGNPDNRNAEISIYGDTEIFFSGSTTLDNGLTVGARVDLEGDRHTRTNDIDMSRITISSDGFGQLMIGGDVGAAKMMSNVAPIVGPLEINDVNGFAANNGIGDIDTNTLGGKNSKIRYTTPSFSGFSLSLSSTPDGQNENQDVVAGSSGSETSVAIAYSGEISGMGVEFDLGRQQEQNVATNTITRGGLVVSMGGFSVGGSYATHESDDAGNTAASTSNDGKVYDIGVGYVTGPYAFAVTYSDAEVKNTVADADEDTATTWSIGASYDMGAGVALVGQYAKGDYQNEGGTLATGNNPSVFVAGIEVAF